MWVDHSRQLLVLLVKEIGQRIKERLFPFEIVVERPLGRLGGGDDIVYRGAVIAVFEEQVPGRLDNAALGGSSFARHGHQSLQMLRGAGRRHAG